MRPRPKKPTSLSADRRAAVDLGSPGCSRDGISDAPPKASGEIGARFDIGTPDAPRPCSSARPCGGHIRDLVISDACACLSLPCLTTILLGFSEASFGLAHAPLAFMSSRLE